MGGLWFAWDEVEDRLVVAHDEVNGQWDYKVR
jgi:hypothetical protein